MSASETKRYAGQTDEAFPDAFTTIPPQPAVKKTGQVSPEQIRQFYEQGYLVVDDVFDPDVLEASRNAISELVEDLAQRMFNAGLIKNLYQEYGLFQRLTMIEKEYPGTTVIMVKQGFLPQAFQNLWSHERLLNVVEQFLGPNIVGHPVWTIRPKTPQNEATTVAWHQDNAYFENEAYKTLILTAWIPMLDANEKNGCLQFVQGGHKTGRMCTHQCRDGPIWYAMLQEAEIERTLGVDMSKDVVTVPVKYGGMVLFNNAIPHQSLNNQSDEIRWSFDFRWVRPEDPISFFGLKDGVLMRTAENPNHVIEWETFNKVDRCTEQQKAKGEEFNEFDTTVYGPWVARWETIHVN